MMSGDIRAPLKGIEVWEAFPCKNPQVKDVLLNISRTSFDTLGFILQTPRLVIRAISLTKLLCNNHLSIHDHV